MASNLESSASDSPNRKPQADSSGAVPPGWLKVGAVAAASAVLGGLAAAWFYRKTLSRLREAEHTIPDTGSSATAGDLLEDF